MEQKFKKASSGKIPAGLHDNAGAALGRLAAFVVAAAAAAAATACGRPLGRLELGHLLACKRLRGHLVPEAGKVVVARGRPFLPRQQAEEAKR